MYTFLHYKHYRQKSKNKQIRVIGSVYYSQIHVYKQILIAYTTLFRNYTSCYQIIYNYHTENKIGSV